MTRFITFSFLALTACETAPTIVAPKKPACHSYVDYEAQVRAFETCLSHSAQGVDALDCEALALRLATREACFQGPLFDGPVIENFYKNEEIWV